MNCPEHCPLHSYGLAPYYNEPHEAVPSVAVQTNLQRFDVVTSAIYWQQFDGRTMYRSLSNDVVWGN